MAQARLSATRYSGPASLVAGVGPGLSWAPMSERPHVLLVCTDHWPAELFGGAGHPTVRTPSLDELALCGTRYTNC